MKIELIHFAGCPHAERARENVASAIRASGGDHEVVEWEQTDDGAPRYVRGRPSPTVLVDGRDVLDDDEAAATASGARGVGGAEGLACRAGAPPSVATILQAISPC